ARTFRSGRAVSVLRSALAGSGAGSTGFAGSGAFSTTGAGTAAGDAATTSGVGDFFVATSTPSTITSVARPAASMVSLRLSCTKVGMVSVTVLAPVLADDMRGRVTLGRVFEARACM